METAGFVNTNKDAIILEDVVGTQVSWKFHFCKKETLLAALRLPPVPLPVGISPHWTCFVLSLLHCNSPNPESVNKTRFALLGISHVAE